MNTKGNFKAWCGRMGLLFGVCSAAFGVRADDIQLGEVVRELSGTAVAHEPVAKAPALGGTAVVSRSQIRSAITRAGLDPDTFKLPRRVKVERKVRNMSKIQVEQLVMAKLSERLQPCELASVSAYSKVRLPSGELTVTLPRRPALRTGRMSLVVQVDAAGSVTHVPVSAQLSCPAPAVQAGERVRLEVEIGSVRVTAPGKAFQTGHLGEVIQVENSATRSRLSGRIVGPQHVQVMR